MQLLALAAAALVVLGVPGLAAVYWLRSRDVSADAVELAAVGYGGIAISALSLWFTTRLLGASWQSVLFASLVGSGVVIAPAVLRAVLRALGSDALGAAGATSKTSPHDEGPRRQTDVDGHGSSLPAEARTRNRHLAVLAAAGALFAGLVWVPFLTYGTQRAGGIHRMAMTDWYKHLVTTTAVGAADSFPPSNPFLHGAEPAPYYYGFHLVAASISRMAAAITGSETGDLVYGSLLLLTLTTAVATPFVAYTAARTIAGGKGGDSRGVSSVPLLAALGATFLAGFDLLPLLLDTIVNIVAGGPFQAGLAGLRAAIPSTHLDYWIHHNERQLNAPYATAIWAPQHLAAVLVALLAIHLVLRRRELGDRTWNSAPVGVAWLLPSALLAGLPALSAYVAVGLGAGVVGAAAFESIRDATLTRREASWRLWLAPGVTAALLALPIAAGLRGGPGPGFVLHPSAAGGWVNGAVWSWWFGESWATNLLDTPAVYLVEFGIIGLLAVAGIWRRSGKGRMPSHQAHVVGLAVTIVVLVTLVRPPVGGPNNLYARPLLLVWFLLAPFAAGRFVSVSGAAGTVGGTEGTEPALLSRWRRAAGAPRWVLVATSVCLLATGYAALGAVLEGSLFWATPPATVEALRWINANAPPGAVVAVHPDEFRGRMGYWLRRRLVLADQRHALLFGAGEGTYEATGEALRAAYASPTPEQAAERFDALDAGAVLVANSDATRAPWLGPACWEIAFDNEAWLVARRTYEGCPDTGR